MALPRCHGDVYTTTWRAERGGKFQCGPNLRPVWSAEGARGTIFSGNLDFGIRWILFWLDITVFGSISLVMGHDALGGVVLMSIVLFARIPYFGVSEIVLISEFV